MKDVVPYSGSVLGKKAQVEQMFNRIAFRYDLMNRLLSFGIDKVWRRRMKNSLASLQPKIILDVASGTGDVAIELAKLQPERIFAIDISEQMMKLGRKKITEQKLDHIIEFKFADAEKLPFEDNKFDAVTVAFGVRNFENLNKGLIEICRVLKPGGKLAVLEFSKPKQFPFAQLYWFYFRHLCPLIAQLITGHRQAYQYLHESVIHFPEGKFFLDQLNEAGFNQTQCKPLTLGVSSLYTAGK